MENTFHTEQFTIRANEVDTTGTLSLPAICNFFQEVAGNNAKDLNFDITDMHEQNLTWVLHRMDIHVSGEAKWRETITVETWPAAGDAVRARDACIGEAVAAAKLGLASAASRADVQHNQY